MAGHPFAQYQKLLEIQFAADLRAGLAANHHGLDPRKIPLEKLGKLVIERFANDNTEDRVAEKLKPLVGHQTMLSA